MKLNYKDRFNNNFNKYKELKSNIEKNIIEENKNKIKETEEDIKNNRLISNDDLKVKLGVLN